MVTPSNSTSGWVVALVTIAPIFSGALGSFLTKYKVRSDYHKKTDDNEKEIKRQADIILKITETLAEHTFLHKGYVSMQIDVRSTRDCVLRIAGHLEVEGPK